MGRRTNDASGGSGAEVIGGTSTFSVISSFVIVLTLACATLLSSDVPGEPGARPIALRLFTVPVLLPEPMDIRDYVLPVGLCVLLIIQAASRMQRRHDDSLGAWFDVLAGATLLCAIGSSLWNGSWELSRGWVFHLAVGVLWARAVASIEWNKRVVWTGAAAIAIVGSFFTYWTQREIGVSGLDIPIGPVTLTAGLAALWMATSAAFLLGCISADEAGSRRRILAAMVGTIVFAASLWLIVASNRRGAWMGLAASMVFLLVVRLWRYVPRAAQRAAIIMAVIASIAVSSLFVSKIRAPDMRVAASYGVRMLYVGKSAEMLTRSPVVGYGPDMFVCRMTEELSPLRSHMPRVLQGLIDETAHNEWVQAAFELGVPGGLLYACLPLSVIAAALWRSGRESSGTRRREQLALATGLIAVVVMEATSINLRYHTLPAWYWTIIGLLLTTRERGPAAKQTPLIRGSIVVLAAAMLTIALSDARNADWHARARIAMVSSSPQHVKKIFGGVGTRFGAVKWMQCEYDRGLALMNVAGQATESRMELTRPAIAVFERINRDWPAHPDPVAQLARCHLLADDPESARHVLRKYIEKCNPFEPQCNLLLAETPGTTTAQQLECLLRALREADSDANMMRLLDRVIQGGGFLADWHARVLAAFHSLEARDVSHWADSLEPEMLRAESLRLARDKRGQDAVKSATLAAVSYNMLFTSRSSYRRAAPAETDAHWRCAEFQFAANPVKCEGPLRIIREAEKALIRGIDDVYAPGGGQDADWMMGPGLPDDVPERFRSMFALSCVIHIAAGRTENLDARVAYCIPPEQRTVDSIRTQRVMCARETLRVYQSVPVELRPSSLKQAARWAEELSR